VAGYRLGHLQQVLLTYGLILIVEEFRSIVWGDDVHSVPVPELLSASIALTDTLSYPVYRLAISAICIVLAVLLWLLVQRTRLGMMIRAGAANREMVQSLGIDIDLLYRFVFALGVALAALAGMIAAPVSSVFPGMGNQVLIVCFVVVVIGGIGSVKGALIGALLIGLVDTFGKVIEFKVGGLRLLPELAGMSVYLLMAVVLLWRPAGLFGKKT
jgi:branched-chain amino acid transport system permease protein